MYLSLLLVFYIRSLFPSRCSFFACKSPQSSEILLKLDPEVVRKFQSKGVKYAGYWPEKSRAEYASWQQQYYTDNKEVLA